MNLELAIGTSICLLWFDSEVFVESSFPQVCHTYAENGVVHILGVGIGWSEIFVAGHDLDDQVILRVSVR